MSIAGLFTEVVRRAKEAIEVLSSLTSGTTRFLCLWAEYRRTAVAAEIEDMPPVREESTSIASFARLTSSVNRPAIDTYVHAPYRSIVHAHAHILLVDSYSIHKSFCKSIHKSILYSIHKSILYSIHKPFCKLLFILHIPIIIGTDTERKKSKGKRASHMILHVLITSSYGENN